MVSIVVVVSPHPCYRGHGGPRGRVRADQAGVPLDEHQAAISTPWRGPVAALALSRERRVPGLRNAIGA
jgi:hypothetical protein